VKEEEVDDDDDVLYGHANLIYENSGEKKEYGRRKGVPKKERGGIETEFQRRKRQEKKVT